MNKIEKMIKFVWDEFIYGGHLLSLGASGILCSTAIIFNQKFSIVFFMLGYVISQLVYLYDHKKDSKKDLLTNPERGEYFIKFKKYFLILFLFYFFLFIFCLIYLNNLVVALFTLFIMLGGLLFNVYSKNLTKKIIGFKNFYISFFWASLVILAGFYYNLDFNLSLLLLFSFIFFRFILSTIFFDIKDIESDKKQNLKTIPVIFGKNKTLSYLHIINIFSFFPIIIGVYFNIFPFFVLSLILFYFYSFYYLEKTKNININIRNLSYIIVDGEYLIWIFVLFFSKIAISL